MKYETYCAFSIHIFLKYFDIPLKSDTLIFMGNVLVKRIY